MSPSLRDQRGSITLGVIAISLVSALILYLMSGKQRIIDSASTTMRDSTQLIEFNSAVETLVQAFTEAEIKYFSALSKAGCENPQSFISALKYGSKCSQPTNGLKVFFTQPKESFYQFVKSCTISQFETECDGQEMSDNTSPILIASVNRNDTNKGIGVITQNSIDFYLFSLAPHKGFIEFIGIINGVGPGGKKYTPVKRTFAIRTLVSNFAHLEVDGRVTQENPGPLARCHGAPWTPLNIFNPDKLECLPFEQLGGGTGLAFYKGRYFGFRPMDGQIIDMFAATINTGSYLVEETGAIAGKAIFPPYSKEDLINVDDITTIGDSIYFVSGLGEHAHIGYLVTDPPPVKREIICELGEMGWAQGYTGIAAHSKSQNVQDLTQHAVATFYLKTDNGDFLIAYVVVDPTDTTGARKCYVIKDSELQQIEYTRTLGFERAEDESRIFYY
jgi:hypothetical protein